MQQETGTAPKVIPATAPPLAEHRKASRSADVAFGWGIAFLLFGCLSALGGFYEAALALAGVFIAMMVVGVMFQHEGERQRQRADLARTRNSR